MIERTTASPRPPESPGSARAFPEIPVIFEVKQTEQHYHIPLLLSPYGFSTSRGS